MKNSPPLKNSSSDINQITIAIPSNNKASDFNSVFKLYIICVISTVFLKYILSVSIMSIKILIESS